MEEDYNSYCCENCGSSYVEEGYKYNLCENCRDKLSKRPIPIKIKIVFIAVLTIVVFSLIRFPASIKGALAYERGKQAEEQSKYHTALKQYKEVSKQYGQSSDIKGRIIIAQYKNGNYDEAINLLIELEGEIIEDEDLYNELDQISSEIESIYTYSNELTNTLEQIKNEPYDVKIQKLSDYIRVHKTDCVAAYTITNLYCMQANYEEAKKYINIILRQYPNNQYGLISLVAIERELGNYDSAISLCNKMLDLNVESSAAYASLARVELRRVNDEKALEYIKKAHDIDPDNVAILETLAEAYHYNNMIDKRDAIIDTIRNHEDAEEASIKYLEEMISKDQ